MTWQLCIALITSGVSRWAWLCVTWDRHRRRRREQVASLDFGAARPGGAAVARSMAAQDFITRLRDLGDGIGPLCRLMRACARSMSSVCPAQVTSRTFEQNASGQKRSASSDSAPRLSRTKLHPTDSHVYMSFQGSVYVFGSAATLGDSSKNVNSFRTNRRHVTPGEYISVLERNERTHIVS